MTQNTWGIIITKVEEDSFKALLSLNIGDEERTRTLFETIKEDFDENTGDPECVIDLVNEHDEYIADYAITLQDAIEISNILGRPIGLRPV